MDLLTVFALALSTVVTVAAGAAAVICVLSEHTSAALFCAGLTCTGLLSGWMIINP